MTTKKHGRTAAEARFNQHYQNILDEALAQTFPASDPVAMPDFTTPDASDDPVSRENGDRNR